MSDERLFAILQEIGEEWAKYNPRDAEYVGDWVTEAWLKVRGKAIHNAENYCARAFNTCRFDYIRKIHPVTGKVLQITAEVVDKRDTGTLEGMVLDQLKEAMPENWLDAWLLSVHGAQCKTGAKLLGISLPAYKSRLCRARKFAKTFLGTSAPL